MNYTVQIFCLLLIFCIATHIYSDFHLQGILASMKQKKYWEEMPEYTSFYKHDYRVSLAMHSLEWSFFVLIPVFVLFTAYYQYFFQSGFDWLLTNAIILYIIWMINAMVHFEVDDAKANDLSINLNMDQIAHFLQIILICIVTTVMWA